MVMRDGTVVEQVYASRFQAELFLYLLPMLMMTLPHDEQVAEAILSPLVDSPTLSPVNVTRPYRIDQHLH